MIELISTKYWVNFDFNQMLDTIHPLEMGRNRCNKSTMDVLNEYRIWYDAEERGTVRSARRRRRGVRRWRFGRREHHRPRFNARGRRHSRYFCSHWHRNRHANRHLNHPTSKTIQWNEAVFIGKEIILLLIMKYRKYFIAGRSTWLVLVVSFEAISLGAVSFDDASLEAISLEVFSLGGSRLSDSWLSIDELGGHRGRENFCGWA